VLRRADHSVQPARGSRLRVAGPEGEAAVSALAPSRDAADAIRGRSLWDDAWRKLKRNRAAVVSACVIAAMAVLVITGPWVARFAYDFADFSSVMTAPSVATGHWFGTDTLGRDMFV